MAIQRTHLEDLLETECGRAEEKIKQVAPFEGRTSIRNLNQTGLGELRNIKGLISSWLSACPEELDEGALAALCAKVEASVQTVAERIEDMKPGEFGGRPGIRKDGRAFIGVANVFRAALRRARASLSDADHELPATPAPAEGFEVRG
jgi:hypothetical protein